MQWYNFGSSCHSPACFIVLGNPTRCVLFLITTSRTRNTNQLMQPRDKAIEKGIILLFVDINNNFDVF